MTGTRLIRAASAPPASISGLRLSVLPVQSGRLIRTGMLVDIIMNAPKLIIPLLTIVLTQASAIGQSIPKPGIKEVQVPYSSLKPSMTLKIGGTADWVLVTSNPV